MADTLNQFQTRMRDALRVFLSSRGDSSLYGMTRYSMGFADDHLNTEEGHGGKNFRSSLCLLVADLYGRQDAALSAALSIELFHNATLIHDDIADEDELRRGRPSLWKLWGVASALNAGDALLLLSYRALSPAVADDTQRSALVQQFLTERYLEVAEGQQLDFALTDIPLSDARITSEAYFKMIEKKTAVLVGAAAKAGGMMAGVSPGEAEILYSYGLALGMAIQLHDDYASLWSETGATGKDAQGDIRARKKTLPIIFALEKLTNKGRERLTTLYASSGPMTGPQVEEVLTLLEDAGSKAYMKARIADYRDKSSHACETLTCSEEGKAILSGLFEEYT